MKFVLLDLGNVVLGVDFRKVFAHWAAAANIPEQRFYDLWVIDDAYKQHEVGNLSFAEYSTALSARFNVTLSLDQWRDGWNDLWTEPFYGVIELLHEIKSQYRLFAFTNTNDTHAECWRRLFGDELKTFEHIYVSSEIGARKPNKEAYLQVCKHMGAKPDEVIFVDDTVENIKGAQAAGLDARLAKGEREVVEVLSSILSS